MKLLPTKLNGLMLFELEEGVNGQGDYFPDERGAYIPFWNFDKLKELGWPGMNEYTQVSVSKSKRAVLRGMHGEPWSKLIYVPQGKVFAVELDLRPESPTFGQFETFELDDHKILFVPQGFGNGFQALEDSLYMYLVNGRWSPEVKYNLVSYKDPDLNIKWPLWEERIVSPKDEGHPPLREVFTNWKAA
jgi:dTDP-4-dehydrorhamnose 3,5-epimerase